MKEHSKRGQPANLPQRNSLDANSVLSDESNRPGPAFQFIHSGLFGAPARFGGVKSSFGRKGPRGL